jgi:hypothetical protein
MKNAELIVEKLNFELTAVGNYPTDKVVHLMRQLEEAVWDLDDNHWLVEAYHLFTEDFSLAGEFY